MTFRAFWDTIGRYFFQEMTEPEKKPEQNYWWSQGLRMFAEATGWIAFPLVAALFIGRWLDSKYHSAPLYFLGLTILAFIISSIGIGVTGVKYMKQIEKDEADKKAKLNQGKLMDNKK